MRAKLGFAALVECVRSAAGRLRLPRVLIPDVPSSQIGVDTSGGATVPGECQVFLRRLHERRVCVALRVWCLREAHASAHALFDFRAYWDADMCAGTQPYVMDRLKYNPTSGYMDLSEAGTC